ncbi:hypothetical protein Tco_0784302 [Tanacetum coccineum]
MAPRAVLMKTGLKSFNTVRPVNTVRSVNTGAMEADIYGKDVAVHFLDDSAVYTRILSLVHLLNKIKITRLQCNANLE